MEKNQLNTLIGRKVKEVRKRKGLTLEQASGMTGVSKPMLGQIERGISNPTVSTLWKIASGLDEAFSTFIEEPKPDIIHIRAEELQELDGGHGGFVVQPVLPKERDRSFEVFYIKLKRGGHYHSHAHQDGVEESLFISEGEVEVMIQERYIRLRKGTLSGSRQTLTILTKTGGKNRQL
ncbi:XRE family transcriptional regulator [Thalassobacillus sp. C254]|uniref:XRE family transcriptional regulator n=1 Tax=Thalassobacillus sp. C254 TaxID=1225341 RepID=UPI0006D1EAC1|nr:XRE family transcriptional regulator [Thalassobacillus sp. C254]